MPDVLINLTGHKLHMYEGGKVIRTIDADRPPFRLNEIDAGLHDVDGIQVQAVQYRPMPLPEPTPGTWLIVSQVAAAGLIAAGVRRQDILYPGPGVSDRGRVVGCRGLRWLVPARPTGTPA